MDCFFVLIETIIAELNIDEISGRSTDEFDDIQYIFIDDPVTSLDDNHLIQLAIYLKEVIVNSKSVSNISSFNSCLIVELVRG